MKIGECVRLGVMRKATQGIFEKTNFLRSYFSFFIEYKQLFYLSVFDLL